MSIGQSKVSKFSLQQRFPGLIKTSNYIILFIILFFNPLMSFNYRRRSVYPIKAGKIVIILVQGHCSGLPAGAHEISLNVRNCISKPDESGNLAVGFSGRN